MNDAAEVPRNHLLTITADVRWGDMDALGHVNNTHSVRFFEQVRMQWLEDIGYRADHLATEGPVIADVSCTFLQPIFYPESLSVSCYGGAPGRSSVKTFYEIRSAKDNSVLYSTGHSHVVWVDYRAMKSIPLPDRIRSYLPARSE